MKKNLYDIKGRTAVITGAAGLLGIEHSIALADIGANIIMTDINEEDLKKASQKVFQETNFMPQIYCMDVTSEESIKFVSSDIKNNLQRVDILINNAAIDPKVDRGSIIQSSRLENFSTDDWDLQMNVGLKGAFLCSKFFGHEMAKNGYGVIINISSDLSVFAPDQRLYMKDNLSDDNQPVKPITYSVIKHGLIGLTKYISTYWANKGVRCNALSPGGVYTNQNEDFVSRLKSLIPMERMADKNEYRGAIQFLCSDASKYLNGQNIVMDGGRSVL